MVRSKAQDGNKAKRRPRSFVGCRRENEVISWRKREQIRLREPCFIIDERLLVAPLITNSLRREAHRERQRATDGGTRARKSASPARRYSSLSAREIDEELRLVDCLLSSRFLIGQRVMHGQGPNAPFHSSD